MNNNFGISSRSFSLLFACYRNHYDALGITPKATQGEIKTAYYKLSMIYHPDKNKGSESANEKFKDITAAYEILGNLKSRRLYDRGIGLFGIRDQTGNESQDLSEVSAKSAKSAMTRGAYRSPIYDFDEWSRLHYGQTFERRVHARTTYQERIRNNSSTSDFKKDNIVVGIMMITGLLFFVSYSINSRSLDEPQIKPKK